MKVTVTVTVDLNPEQWTTAFGVEGARDIRQDVKSYVGNGVQGMGVFGNGEVDASVEWK